MSNDNPTNIPDGHINTDDNITVETLTVRVDELEGDEDLSEADKAELKELHEVLDELQGEGGDHQWNGDWYPAYLIREDNFTDAMKELCEDIGDLPSNLPSYIAIDWEKTANNLRVDYSSIEIGGVTFWYR